MTTRLKTVERTGRARLNTLGMALAAALFGSCASTGVRVDEGQLAKFEKGRTTYAEVLMALGPPTSTLLQANGQRLIMYTYAHAQTRAASLIPVVGLFAGGMDVHATNVTLLFDDKGVLLSDTSSETKLGAGSGLVSGQAQAPRP